MPEAIAMNNMHSQPIESRPCIGHLQLMVNKLKHIYVWAKELHS